MYDETGTATLWWRLENMIKLRDMCAARGHQDLADQYEIQGDKIAMEIHHILSTQGA